MSNKTESAGAIRNNPYLRNVIEPFRGFHKRPLHDSIRTISSILFNGNGDTQSAIHALTNTGILLDGPRDISNGQLALHIEERHIYVSEGLFDITFSWENTRLLSLGFVADENTNILVLSSQRHKLGETYRREVNSDEKKSGDSFIRTFQSETGMHIEAFCGLIGSLHLAKKMEQHLPNWNGKIKFIDFEEQDKVKKLREKEGKEIHIPARLKEWYSNEIEKWRSHLDMEAMLANIGIHGIFSKNGKYIEVNPYVLQNAFEAHFTDDERFPNRHKYRKLFYSIIHP